MEPVDAHNGGVEAQNRNLKVYGPVVADSNNFDEKQDPDANSRSAFQ
jgi:hypothetical protein